MTHLSLQQERQIVLLFAIESLGGSGTKRAVLDWINSQEIHIVDESETHIVRSNEAAWRNYLAWDRDKLVKLGAIANLMPNDWRITESGRAYLSELSAQLAEAGDLQYINPSAVDRMLQKGLAVSSDYPWSGETEFVEGSRTLVWTVRYERNSRLRDAAIAIHGTKCQCCQFDFGEAYGPMGSGFIEVHHTKPVSSFQCETAVDAKTDMVVLCSNCHRMIHRKKGSPLSVSELGELINSVP